MGYKVMKYGKKQRNGVQNGEIEYKIAKWGTVGSRVSSGNPFFSRHLCVKKMADTLQ
jgi:hypothetical protein